MVNRGRTLSPAFDIGVQANHKSNQIAFLAAIQARGEAWGTVRIAS